MRDVVRLLATLAVALSWSACARPDAPSRAALLVNVGHSDQALTLLREHLDQNPDDLEAQGQLIRVLGHLGQLGEAEEAARRLARTLGPADPRPWLELGHAYELGHRYEEALALYDRAAAVAPKDARGPRMGGMRAARWGEVAWAAPRLEEALRRQSRDAEAWHALGLVRVHQGRYKEAEVAYLQGLQVDPEALAHRVGLATLALRLDRPAVALEHYDALAARRPDDGDVQLGRAYALYRLGRLPAARAALEQGKRLGAAPSVVVRLEQVLVRGSLVRDRPTSDTELGHAPRTP